LQRKISTFPEYFAAKMAKHKTGSFGSWSLWGWALKIESMFVGTSPEKPGVMKGERDV